MYSLLRTQRQEGETWGRGSERNVVVGGIKKGAQSGEKDSGGHGV